MKILLTNDDGVFAPGLRYVAALLQQSHELTVVAPLEEQSGKSRAITLYRPLAVRKAHIPDIDAPTYSVNGTPADCVRVGLLYLLKNEAPDLIVSGINCGLNTANDVPYSGTVSAAVEALHFNKPAIALSALRKGAQAAYDTSCQALDEVLNRLPDAFFDYAFALNINTPFCTPEAVQGMKVLPSRMNISDEYEEVGTIGDEVHIRVCNRYPKEARANSDLAWLRENYVTLSPLTDGCKAHEQLDLVTRWLDK